MSNERKVPQVRTELERLMQSAEGVEDIDSLLGIVHETGQQLIHLQWLEQQMLPLITDAKSKFNEAKEALSVSEDREALGLINTGTSIGKAEKMARLSHSEHRKSLNKIQEARNRYEDEHRDLRGFRDVVEGCKMTLHQKIKSLMDEYRSTPYQKNREE